MPGEESRDGARRETKAEPGAPKYVPPRIVTYTSEEILEQIGPALACTGTPTCTLAPKPATPYRRGHKRRPRPG